MTERRRREDKDQSFDRNAVLMTLKVGIFTAIAARAPTNKTPDVIAGEAEQVFKKFLDSL